VLVYVLVHLQRKERTHGVLLQLVVVLAVALRVLPPIQEIRALLQLVDVDLQQHRPDFLAAGHVSEAVLPTDLHQPHSFSMLQRIRFDLAHFFRYLFKKLLCFSYVLGRHLISSDDISWRGYSNRGKAVRKNRAASAERSSQT